MTCLLRWVRAGQKLHLLLGSLISSTANYAGAVNNQYRKKKAWASKERPDVDSFDVVAGPTGRGRSVGKLAKGQTITPRSN
jgi:hypothetical protein